MKKVSWPLFAPPGFFNRKAENRPLGWKISLSTCGGRAAAMRERRPAPAAQGMTGTVYTKACISLFPGASAPHCIHWTAGKLLFRLQSEHRVRSGAAAGCSFPDGHAQRSRRLRCADPHANKNIPPRIATCECFGTSCGIAAPEDPNTHRAGYRGGRCFACAAINTGRGQN